MDGLLSIVSNENFIENQDFIYRGFRKVLVQEKNYNDFKGTYFLHLRHILEYFKFNRRMVHIFLRL